MKQVYKLILTILISCSLGILISGCFGNPDVEGAKVAIHRENNPDRAIELTQGVVAQDPQNAEAYYVMGEAYGMKGQYKEMNDAFNNSLKASPKFTAGIEGLRQKFWQNLFVSGVTSIKQNKLEVALEQFILATEIMPMRTEAYKNLAYTHSQMGNDSSAIEVYKKAVEIDSSDLDLQTSLGIFYYRAKDYDNAIKVLQPVLEKAEPGSKEYTDALYHLSYSYDLTDRPEKAIEMYKKALELTPGDKDLIFNLSRLYFLQEKYQESIDGFQQILEDNPEDFEATINVGNAYIKLEEWDKAIPQLKRATELKPDNANAWDLLGVALVNAGKIEEGKDAFAQAEKIRSQ